MNNYDINDLADNLDYINETKGLIKNAIIEKGQEVSDSDTFRSYAAKISNISGGGSNTGNLYVYNKEEDMYRETNVNIGDRAFVYDGNNNRVGNLYDFIETNKIDKFRTISNLRLENNLTFNFDVTDDYVLSSDLVRIVNILEENYPNLLDIVPEYYYFPIIKVSNSIYKVYGFYHDDIKVDGMFFPAYYYVNRSGIFCSKVESSFYLSIPASVGFNSIGSQTSDGIIQKYPSFYLDVENSNILKCQEYIIDIDNNTCTLNEYNGSLHKEDIFYFENVDLSNAEIILTYLSKDYIKSNTSLYIRCYLTEGYVSKTATDYIILKKEFTTIPTTKFTANSSKVWNGWFYGINGVEQGELGRNIVYNDATKYQFVDRLNTFYGFQNKINTDGLNSVGSMFVNCINISLVPSFNTSSVTSMYSMFGSSSLFKNSNSAEKLLTIPPFNMNLITNISLAFKGCSNLITIPNINTSLVNSFSSVFLNCYNLKVVPNLDTSNSVSMQSVFDNCYNLKVVPNFNTVKVNQMINAFRCCYNLKIAPKWNMSNVVNAQYMYYHCNNLTTVYDVATPNLVNMDYMFTGCNNLTELHSFSTANVTSMSYTLSGCNSLTYIPNFVTNKVNLMVGLCMNCRNITSVPNFNTSSCSDMHSIFDNCVNLTTVPNLNLSNCKIAYQMFYNCQNIVSIPDFNISLITSASDMFYNCVNLKTVPNLNYSPIYSNINVGFRMFCNCKSLTSLGTFNTLNLYDYGGMFIGCDMNLLRQIHLKPNTKIQQFFSFQNEDVDIQEFYSNLNIGQTKDLSKLFYSYHGNTISNLSVSDINASYMFYNCDNLKHINNVFINGITNMSDMFADCYNLITLPNLNTINCTNMSLAFAFIRYITSLSNYITNKVTNMYSICSCCYNLVDVPQWNTSNCETLDSAFSYCNKLSNASIQNIINMCLNSNVTNTSLMNLNTLNQNSPLHGTKFNSSYYSNRLAEITAAGWSY